MPKKESEAPLSMLPAHLREAGDEEVDVYLASKLEAFEVAMEESNANLDPIRRFLAVESLRLSLDPRVDQAEVRSRSNSLLSTSKILGLDRDVQRFDVSTSTVEVALKRLKEATKEGLNAAGQLIQARAGEAPEEVHDGSSVLLRSASLCGERAVEEG